MLTLRAACRTVLARTAFALLAAAQVTASQLPSIAERNALADRYWSAPDRIRGAQVEVHWLDDGSSFWFRAGSADLFVDPRQGVLRPARREDRAREPRQPDATEGRRVAPWSERFAVIVGGNLVVAQGAQDAGVALTDDGGPRIQWSVEPGCWSPDGSALFALRRDAHGVHGLPVVDYLDAVETLQLVPYVKAGTPLPAHELVVFHLAQGTLTEVDLPSAEHRYLFPIGWREGGAEVLFLRLDREATRLDLMAADPATGASRVVLTERRETFVAGLDFIRAGWREAFTPVPGRDRFLWLSERDGWRHVYHYDYRGTRLGRVTSGAFPVLRVLGVDPQREHVFLMANAEDGPYDTHAYRADLAGGALVRLTEGSGEHEVELSPSKRFLVDTHSSLERPPVTELRSADGELLRVLAEADVSLLEELGWVPPEPFVVKAADGETDLHGVLFKPSYFDERQRYPVIDHIYSGPFTTIVPNDYGSRSPHARRAQALAQMGFVTFLLDPRGTTERGKAFQDASYGRIGEIEIPDHVAALRQIAARHPYVDLDHVGVYGHSWGGYFALRAMLGAPDVFHAGVAGAPGELTEAAPINEPYMRTPQHNPQGYAAGLNAPLASRLEGELLILHGTADVNAPFSTSMRMVDALIEADKSFDLIVLPGATHFFQGRQARYASGRIRSFFLEHLRGE